VHACAITHPLPARVCNAAPEHVQHAEAHGDHRCAEDKHENPIKTTQDRNRKEEEKDEFRVVALRRYGAPETVKNESEGHPGADLVPGPPDTCKGMLKLTAMLIRLKPRPDAVYSRSI
jgi:hypothetical protein